MEDADRTKSIDDISEGSGSGSGSGNKSSDMRPNTFTETATVSTATEKNPTFLSVSAAVLFLLLLMLPFSAFACLAGGAGGAILCESYPQQILPRVTAARSRATVELRSLVQKARQAKGEKSASL